MMTQRKTTTPDVPPAGDHGRPAGLTRGRSGQSVLEFAVLLPIMLLVVFGVVEFGRALMTTNVLTAAAREGARVAAVGGTEAEATARVNEVLSAAKIDTTQSVVDVSEVGANDEITVTVTTNFVVLTGSIVFDVPTITLRGSTVMRFEG